MLEVTGLNVRYGSVEALRDVSIKVETGRLVAILGANGAGKSTLLRAISGIANVASGTIALRGEAITGLGPEEIVRRGVSHVPEGRGIFPDLTVSENLMIGAYVRRGQNVSADYSRVMEMFPPIERRERQFGYTLSGGEQQMLAIGRALMAAPKVLLADELSLGLAPIIVKQVFAKLDEARKAGDRTWLIFGEQRYTYAQAHELSNRYANGFRELGVGKGDHVAVMLPNCSEFIWTIWGLAKLGAVTVPLNTAARGELLRYFITQSDSSCVVVAAEWADRVAEALGSDHRVRACLTLGGAGTRLADCGATCVDLASFERAPADEPDRTAVLASDPQYIMYTSGTTGPSRGVIRPHSLARGVGRSLAQHFGYRPGDVLYTCL